MVNIVNISHCEHVSMQMSLRRPTASEPWKRSIVVANPSISSVFALHDPVLFNTPINTQFWWKRAAVHSFFPAVQSSHSPSATKRKNEFSRDADEALRNQSWQRDSSIKQTWDLQQYETTLRGYRWLFTCIKPLLVTQSNVQLSVWALWGFFWITRPDLATL